SGRRGEMTTWSPAFGAQIDREGVRFSVWAPNASTVELELSGEGARTIPMDGDDEGRFAVHVPGVAAGARYLFCVDGQDGKPDPYSRFQPDGVHGASEIVDPAAYSWSDAGWPGLTAENQAIYELHVGTMTPEGTFRALIDQLKPLKDLGITAIELMPVAQCPGEHNWGYDGVDLFAPSHTYGTPDDLRALVDAAHAAGL